MPITYHDLYLDTRRALANAGDITAEMDARELVRAASGKSLAELLRDQTLFTTDEVAQRVEEMTRRCLAGEPAAYILGEWSLLGLDFWVSPEVMIPRVDTEALVKVAIRRLEEIPGPTRVLDLCAGSGCVGIALASQVRNSRVVLVDLSDGALDLCRRNIRRHNLTSRVVHLKGDALQPPSATLGQFDVLTCNPPYIPSGDIQALDPSVRDYEPRLALDGGPDGMDFYRAIPGLWISCLKPGGHMIFEVGIGQSEHVAWQMVKAGFENVVITRDTNRIDRVVDGRKPGGPPEPQEAQEEEAEAGHTGG